MSKKRRPFRIPTKSAVRKFFHKNARLMREAYGYENEEVNAHLEWALQISGGAVEAIDAFDATLNPTGDGV